MNVVLCAAATLLVLGCTDRRRDPPRDGGAMRVDSGGGDSGVRTEGGALGFFEDFEAGLPFRPVWYTAGSYEWTVSPSMPTRGAYSARSGPVNNWQTSVLAISLDVAARGDFTFTFRVSSDPEDYLLFIVDDVERFRWSGTMSDTIAFPLDPGAHLVGWVYMKSDTGSAGDDAAWIDDVSAPTATAQLPPMP